MRLLSGVIAAWVGTGFALELQSVRGWLASWLAGRPSLPVSVEVARWLRGQEERWAAELWEEACMWQRRLLFSALACGSCNLTEWTYSRGAHSLPCSTLPHPLTNTHTCTHFLTHVGPFMADALELSLACSCWACVSPCALFLMLFLPPHPLFSHPAPSPGFKQRVNHQIPSLSIFSRGGPGVKRTHMCRAVSAHPQFRNNFSSPVQSKLQKEKKKTGRENILAPLRKSVLRKHPSRLQSDGHFLSFSTSLMVMRVKTTALMESAGGPVGLIIATWHPLGLPWK